MRETVMYKEAANRTGARTMPMLVRAFWAVTPVLNPPARLGFCAMAARAPKPTVSTKATVS
jgi:hypothetical protein